MTDEGDVKGTPMTGVHPHSSSIIDSDSGKLHPSRGESSTNTAAKSTSTEEGNESQELNQADYLATKLLVLLLIPSFIEKLAERQSIPVLPVFAQRELHASPKLIGIIVAINGLGKIVCNVPSGWIVSKVYRDNHDEENAKHRTPHGPLLIPLVLSCLILASAYVGISLSHSAFSVIGARLWEGAGLSLWTIGRQTIINDLLTKKTRGRYMANLGGIARMASVIAPFVGGLLASNDKLRRPFYCQAGVIFVNAVVILCIMEWVVYQRKRTFSGQEEGDTVPLLLSTDVKSYTEEGTEASTSIEEQTESMPDRQTSTISSATNSKDPMSWLLVMTHYRTGLAKLAVLSFCTYVTRVSRHLLFPLQAMKMGYSANDIGVMTSITFLMEFIMFPMAGHVMDRYGRKYAGVPSLVIMGASLASVPLLMNMFPTSFVALVMASALGGIGNGLSSGLLKSIAGDMSPSNGQDRAKFFALFRICADAGSLLGPWASGVIAEQWSLNVSFEVVAGIALTGGLWLACVIDA